MAGALALLLALPADRAAAQSPPAPPAPPAPAGGVTREEFERRLAELENKYQSDIAARDKAIAELRAELESRPPAEPSRLDLERARRQKDMTDAMMSQIEAEQAYVLPPRSPVSFNPDIALITDFLANWSNDRANDAYNRADVRELELDFRAAVHPSADAVAIVALERDVENPVFPEPGEFAEGPETSVNLEEVYLFLHDFGVPNLTAKIGRFNLTFGRQNVLHLHDLPTADPPFVNQAFLAPESLSDAGLSLSYLIPNPWEQYFEVTFEIVSGEGASSESPTLSGDLTVDSPVLNTHLRWNVDVARDWNLEVGGSWLWGHADADNTLDLNLLGGDITLVRTDPSGGFNNFLLQSEFIHGLVDRPGGFTERSWGVYVLAQQQVHKDWYVGTRLDWTENPNDPSSEVWGVSPYVSWYWSETLRFRIEYQHRAGDVPDADVIALQVTWVFGAHPPHPYWAMR
jgi:hypothetical protein